MKSLLWLGLCGVVLGCSRADQNVSTTENVELVDTLVEGNCQDGREAFKSEFYSFVRSTPCVECHGGSHDTAPPWGGSLWEESYHRIKAFVDFSNLEQSRIVFRASNGHCDAQTDGYCSNPATRQEFLTHLKSWWERGESKCEDAGYKKSDAVGIPSGLSTTKFTSMSWSLATLGAAFTNVRFTAEVKILGTVGQGGAELVLRNPRFSGNVVGKGVQVRSLRFFVNGKTSSPANSYEKIDTTVQPLSNGIMPVLSHELLIVKSTNLSSDKISVGFLDVAAVNTLPSCKAASQFTQHVAPLINQGSCTNCHSADKPQSVLQLSKDGATLCSQVLQYTWKDILTPQTFFEIPLKGAQMGHPAVTSLTRGAVQQGMERWLKEEFRP